MHITDLTGKQYPAQLTSTLDAELNGNQSLSATILPTKVNKDFIDDITEMWTITDHDSVEHRIIHVVRRGKGDDMTVDIKAIPLFYDVMDTLRIYDRYDEHMTAQLAFSRIFEDTGFSFTLNGSFDAVQWEGFGDGETRLETFKRSLERYKCEFRIVGNIVYLEHQIGNDTNHQYRHKLNASNIVQEVDANELWTYAKGYGDYGDGGGGEDWQNAKLTREYTSPLAKIIGIRHAPPIKNGNITTKAQMDAQLKTLVDESLKISITANIHDLTRQNYPIAQSQLGDRVFVIDERIGLDEEVRIVNKSITRNWRGDILDVNLTFGSEGLAKRHQSNLNTALKNVTDWITGRKTIPYSIVDEAIKNATQALKNAQTELKFENGILAIDKQDPNKVVLFNSAGVGISSDGGNTFRTAMTGDGLVADVIYAGTLNADRVAVYGGNASEYSHIQGSTIELRGTYKRTWRGETETHDVRTRLHKGHIRFRNDSLGRSLYMSEYGISTYLDGEGELGGSSGTILWWDEENSPTGQRGITVNSYGGTAALTSDYHHALVKSRYSTDIESTESTVNITPFSSETKRGFSFGKSPDRLHGYFLFGDVNKAGLRITNSNDGVVQVIDSNYTTGGTTVIEAGSGVFNRVSRRSGTNYLDIATENHLRVGTAADGSRRIEARPVYARTYSSAANVHITPEFTLGRSTSASKYKNAIEKQFSNDVDQLEHSKKILNLNISSWYDKWECDTLAKEIEKGCKLSEDNFKLKRYVGLVAEDVRDVGLDEHVVYGSDGKEVEEIAYDRLWIHLIPVTNDHEDRLSKIEKILGVGA